LNYTQYGLATIGTTSGILALNYELPGTYLGASIGVLGSMIGYHANEKLKEEAKAIQEELRPTRNTQRQEIVSQTIDRLILSVAELETNYQKLIKVHQGLSLLSNQPTNSLVTNTAYKDFLNDFINFQESMKMTRLNGDIEQG